MHIILSSSLSLSIYPSLPSILFFPNSHLSIVLCFAHNQLPLYIILTFHIVYNTHLFEGNNKEIQKKRKDKGFFVLCFDKTTRKIISSLDIREKREIKTQTPSHIVPLKSLYPLLSPSLFFPSNSLCFIIPLPS